MEKIKEITTESVVKSFSRSLRMNVGLQNDYSVSEISEVTAISESTIRSYMEEYPKQPSLGNLLRIFAAINSSSMVNRFLEPIGYFSFQKVESDPDIMKVINEAASFISTISKANIGGSYDHTYHNDICYQLDALIANACNLRNHFRQVEEYRRQGNA